MRIHRFALATLAAAGLGLGLGQIASAADLPVKAAPRPFVAAYNWTGLYIGGDVGYGWAKSDGTLTTAAGLLPQPYSSSPSGVLGGGFIGGNYQINQFVIGAELDWQAASIKGDSGPIGAGPYTITTKVKSYGSLRARLGYAVDRWLVFGTGGWAWGNWSTAYAFTGAAPFFTNDASKSGWTLGAGAEYAITNNWLARLEYRYTSLGTTSYVSTATNSAEAGNKVKINDLRLGIAYKF